jgi:translation initiation factor IF-2
MTVGTKIRVYDIARELIPKSIDEKNQKKIQTDITKEIINLAPEYGQYPKTASSSIESEYKEQILKRIDLEDIVKKYSGEEGLRAFKIGQANIEKEAREGTVEDSTDPNFQIRRLKIVRRIAAPVEEESPSEESPENSPGDLRKTEAIETPESKLAEDSAEEKISEDIHIKEMMDSYKKPQATHNQAPMRSMKQVKSIPLKPFSAESPVGQPYRVAKPSVNIGIGRTKRRRSPADEEKIKKPKSAQSVEADLGPKEITILKPMTVRELSQKIGVPETSIITHFFMKKIIKTVNDILERDLIVEYLESNNYIVYTEEDDLSHEELKSTLAQDETAGHLISRPPVVTIMGHVDHGKTTLLDVIRQSKMKVVDQESGGITQHISAYRIETHDYDANLRKITFIDTPGHEAFSAMRRRGATITDMVILIVAADDGVMPQTIECIKHIKETKVPFLVAVNKIDKPGANTDKILGQLAEYDILVEQYGGTVVCSMISALKNQNIDDLLEKILLVADAELSEKIRSNPNRLAVGTIIEAELSRSRGPLATVLIQNGTLRIGDHVAAGSVWGRVKAMFDENDKAINEADPSSPVKILGLSGVPKAGDSILAYKTIKEAKEEAEKLAHEELENKRFKGLSAFASGIKEGQENELRVLIKADVQGSAEAISHEINKLSTGEVLVKPIAVETGSITSNDVDLAYRTGAVLVGFHVGTDSQTAKLAEKLGVRIKTYEVIYQLTDDIERAVLGLHEPEKEEIKLGELEVRKLFVIDKRTIAGSYVISGKIQHKQIARVLRDDVQIYEGKVDYLRRFKDEVKEVKEGYECGLSFEKYNDLQEGDKIQCWTIKEVHRSKL